MRLERKLILVCGSRIVIMKARMLCALSLLTCALSLSKGGSC